MFFEVAIICAVEAPLSFRRCHQIQYVIYIYIAGGVSPRGGKVRAHTLPEFVHAPNY